MKKTTLFVAIFLVLVVVIVVISRSVQPIQPLKQTAPENTNDQKASASSNIILQVDNGQ